MACDAQQPELMFRPQWWRGDPATLARSTVVCGCGGGMAVREALPALLSRCPRLVLDADALNAVAADEALARRCSARARRAARSTVLTPHPLEAARLLAQRVAEVQADRLQAARTLAQRHGCMVLLKGSGSVIAYGRRRRWDQPHRQWPAGQRRHRRRAGRLGRRPVGAAGRPPGDAASAHQALLAATWLHGRAARCWHACWQPGAARRALTEAMRDATAAPGRTLGHGAVLRPTSC